MFGGRVGTAFRERVTGNRFRSNRAWRAQKAAMGGLDKAPLVSIIARFKPDGVRVGRSLSQSGWTREPAGNGRLALIVCLMAGVLAGALVSSIGRAQASMDVLYLDRQT